MTKRPNYYKSLKISKNASENKIKKTYRKLARQYHPDHNHGDKKAKKHFKKISQTHNMLSNPEKRKTYDHSSGPFRFDMPGGFDPGSFSGGFGDVLSDLFGRATGGAGAGQRTGDARSMHNGQQRTAH